MISITNRSIDELTNAVNELEKLTGKATFTKQDEARNAYLLAKISLLKQGVSVSELRAYEQDRLLKEAGFSRAPERARTKLDADIETEWRNFVRGGEVRLTSIPPDREIRANEAGSQSITAPLGTQGGYFVPQGMYPRAMESMRQYDEIFDPEFSNIFETDTGANTPVPAWDDVQNASVQIGETVQSSEVDIANFGEIQLNAYSFRSKIVAVSIELLQDSAFPWGMVLERVFAGRHARGVGKAIMTGSGVASPTGLVTAVLASGVSPIIANGSGGNTGTSETGATSIGTADVGRLYAALDPAYRPGAKFYANDATIQYIAQLVDKNGRPIIEFTSGEPTIWGIRVANCPSMPTMASGHNSMLYGNPMYFVQRRVPSSMYVRAFRENPTLVQYGLVGFESWMRVDSNLVAPNASYAPYQVLQTHS